MAVREDGLTRAAAIREATASDASGIARVHVDAWRATYRGIVPDAHLDAMSHVRSELRWCERLTAPDAPGWFTLVADADATVAGFASAGPERSGLAAFAGEIGGLYVLPEFQGKGMGRALVHASVGRLLEAGLPSLLIWVLRDNPSRAFYQRLGGEVVMEQPIEIGGANLIEVAYGWPDARRLLPDGVAP